MEPHNFISWDFESGSNKMGNLALGLYKHKLRSETARSVAVWLLTASQGETKQLALLEGVSTVKTG